MSIITTYKCDGCGRISRRKEDTFNWLQVNIYIPIKDDEYEGVYKQHNANLCSPECLTSIHSDVSDRVREMIDA